MTASFFEKLILVGEAGIKPRLVSVNVGEL